VNKVYNLHSTTERLQPENKIGVQELRSFLFTVRDGDRASCGLFATTSFFSRDANRLAAEYAYQLKLRDFGGIKEWLENYGRWTEKHSSGIWLPHPPKPSETMVGH
jgi:restriction endonuclease Mrr